MKLRLEDVSHRFDDGSPWCLRDVSLTVDRGEVVGLAGPTGAGKSLLLRVASTLVVPVEGAVSLDDLPRDAHASQRRHIGYVSPTHGCPEGLTARAYLGASAALHGRGDDDVESALELTDLLDRADARGRGLSYGERRRLELARALLHDPSLLLLDDPALGLDGPARDDLADFLVTLGSLGKAVLVASSQLDPIAHACDRLLSLTADHRLAEAP